MRQKLAFANAQFSYIIENVLLDNIVLLCIDKIEECDMLIKKERKSLYGRKTKENRRFKWI